MTINTVAIVMLDEKLRKEFIQDYADDKELAEIY
jgi:hypothetical protein